MPEAVDVGSVLGGRYKITGYVLASAEKDLVLDGMDQVLNRPVSILVASEGNAAQVTATARDLATGDRDENIQVLDLSITDSRTYLVTNRAPAADMLDLIVPRESVEQGASYEESAPSSLSSEIFGGSRSDDDDYDGHPGEEQQRPSRLSGLTKRFGRQGAAGAGSSDGEGLLGSDDGDTSGLPRTITDTAASHQRSHEVPPPPTHRPGGASAAGPAGGTSTSRDLAVGAAGAGAAASLAAQGAGRTGSDAPPSDLADEAGFLDTEDDDGVEEDTSRRRTFTRVLVGVVLTAILALAVVLAVTTLGSIVDGTDDDPAAAPTETVEEVPDEATAPPVEPAEPVDEIVTPVIAGISRLVPDSPNLDAGNDANLPSIVDGDPSTFWGNQVYASDAFGGLASSFAFVVELEEESTVSEVSITQLDSSGGSFSVLTNDTPTLEGAEQVAQGSFTAPTVTLPVTQTDGGATAQYVIVNFTQLPRLSIQAPFPFGLRIAEITVE